MKKAISVALVFVLALGLLAGCTGGGSGSGGEEEKRTLVLAEDSQWWGADMTLLDGSSFTQGLIADPLVVCDEEGNMEPCIAEAVSVSEDGLTITLTMPEGMRYASGEELLPEDVVASLERFKEVAPFADNLACIESMEIDGQDVILHLAEFTSDISVSLSGSFITVQDKDVLDASSDDELLWGAKPYGMYYLDEYVEGSHVVLKRNDNYWTNNPFVSNKQTPYFEEITVRFIPEEFTMANALNVGDIEGTFSISAEGLSQLTREDVEVETFINIPNIDYLEFNLKSSILSDANVRKAIALAVDRDALAEANSGMVLPAYSIITEGTQNYCEEFASYYKANFNTDVEAARALLAEAGWADSDGDGVLDKDGQALQLLLVANDGAIENITAQSLQIQLGEIGIDLKLEMYADYYHYDVIYEGNYDIGLEHFGWQEPINLLMYALTDEANVVSAGIDGVYFDTILKAQHTVDNDERTAIIGEIEHMLADNWITVPLYTGKVNRAMSKHVKGIVFTGTSAVYFNDLRWE